MPAWLDRIATRAAAGTPTPGGRLPAAGAGFANTIKTAPSGPVTAATAPVNYSSPGNPQLPNWDGRSALENGYYQTPYVMRPLQVIADTIAALPWRAGMNPDDPAQTNPNAPLARLLGPATPQAPGGPNPSTSSQGFWAWSIVQKLATGKMAWELQVDPTAKGADGTPAIVGLWPLVSFLINPVPSAGGTTYFSGYKYQLPQGDIDLNPARVFYAWRKSQVDWRQPESLMQSAALAISISVALERYMWALLRNGLVATHVITSSPIEEPDLRRGWEEQFISNFTGFDQAGKPIFAYAETDGDGKVSDALNIQSIAQTSEQAQLLALQVAMKDEILVALGVPESLIGNASQRIYANADSEYRTFWTTRVLGVIAELQDDINTVLAPRLGAEVGWFDLSRVVALQPPQPFAQPQLTDLLAPNANGESVMTIGEAQQLLGVNASGYTDTSNVAIGEESSIVGNGPTGATSAQTPEMRDLLAGWRWECRGVNTTTLRSGTAWVAVYNRPHITVRHETAPERRGVAHAEKVLDLTARLRERRTPQTATASTVHHKLGTHGLWGDKARQLPAYIQNVAHAMERNGHPESEAIQIAVGIVKDWAAGKATNGGKTTPDVQAAAARAIAEWEGLKAGAHARRDMGTVTETSSAADLLPAAQPIPPAPEEAELVGPHRYVAKTGNTTQCAKCGKGPLAKVHRDHAAAHAEARHRGTAGHVHTPTGHAPNPARRRITAKKAHVAALAGYEQHFTVPLNDLFAKQEKSALVRLTGNRGKQMIRRATATAPAETREDGTARQPGPEPSNPPSSEPAAAPPATSVDPAAIFDLGYWNDQTAPILHDAYSKVAATATGKVRTQLGPDSGITEQASSLSDAQVDAALRMRAQTVATQINQTTYDNLTKTIGEGMSNGESTPQLAKRVRATFSGAGQTRAEMIARTEANSASNIAQNTYAANLPMGVVAGKEWLAIHDERTRPTHRVADGQTQPIGVPFRVGGFAMDHPGDPTAPPDETINCRCTTAFIPMAKSHLLLIKQPAPPQAA